MMKHVFLSVFIYHVNYKFFKYQKILRAETEGIARGQWRVDQAPRLISE